MDVLNLKLVMTVSFVLFKSQYILDFFNRYIQSKGLHLLGLSVKKRVETNPSFKIYTCTTYCFFIKVLFTYEYTLQNVRLQLLCLMNNFAESIYKKQKL